MPSILHIESATPICSVALSKGDQLIDLKEIAIQIIFIINFYKIFRSKRPKLSLNYNSLTIIIYNSVNFYNIKHHYNKYEISRISHPKNGVITVNLFHIAHHSYT